MNRRFLSSWTVVLVAILPLARAEDAKPNPVAPASQPTTPELFASVYRQAMKDQNPDALRTLYETKTADQSAVADAIVEQEILQQQINVAIGRIEPRHCWPGFSLDTTWRVDSDHASIDNNPQARHWSPRLILIESQRKVDLPGYNRYCEWDKPEQVKSALALLKSYNALLRSVQDDVKSKRFATTQALQGEVERKMAAFRRTQ